MVDNLIIAYSIIILAVIGFQIALILGAPWGRITQGGAIDGALPLKGRIIAGISIFLLLGMIFAMSSIAGEWPLWPRWTGWVIVGINGIMCLLNWITRSQPERYIWGPITTAILSLALIIMLISD
jgi:protein-S-isoprenylcysteine O-methyltransferase Ste14